jgi:hypothetical protein
VWLRPETVARLNDPCITFTENEDTSQCFAGDAIADSSWRPASARKTGSAFGVTKRDVDTDTVERRIAVSADPIVVNASRRK